MKAWQATVQDDRGNAIPNPAVEVFGADGVTPAVVYRENGTAYPTNVVQGNLEGFVQFWAKVGKYVITNGSDAWVWSNESTPPVSIEYDSIAEAVAANSGGAVRVHTDARDIPSEFNDTLIEYTEGGALRNYSQTSFSANRARRIFRAMSGSHAGRTDSVIHTELLASGSTRNGPANASVGQSVYITKRGYAGGSATAGEIDALEIFLRQDGPDGLPSADPGSSDAAALMINAQNVGTCGFVAVLDATSSNISRASGFPIDRSMQVQAGVVDANNAAGKIAYGYTAVMKVGQGRTAFHAGTTGTGSWENLFDSPNLKATWAGELLFKSTGQYADYGARVARAPGLNSQMIIANRGTGGIAVNVLDAGTFTVSTSSIARVQVSASGNLQPATDVGVDLGNSLRRWATTYTLALNVSGNSVTASALPVYATNTAAKAAGLAAGRVFRTADGEMRVVV